MDLQHQQQMLLQQAQQQQQQNVGVAHANQPHPHPHHKPKHALHLDPKEILEHRREQYKSRNMPTQESRRQSALQRQKQDRMKKTEAKRLANMIAQQDQQVVLYDGGTSASVEVEAEVETGKQRAELEKVFAHELQMPEWMIDIPTDLHGGWFVMARPEGKHCLVISSNGTTVARDRAGRLLHRFQSSLPNGSARSSRGANDYCILDCVFNEELETMFVVDVICWKSQLMYESNAEFRFFWLQSRIGELGQLEKLPGVNDFRIALLPVYECNAEGLSNAYAGALNYPRDGLMFFNKEGRYWSGLTPLVLKWKDARSSRFPIDTPDGITPFPIQTAVLQIDTNGNLSALSGQVLGSLNAQQIAQHALSPGDLVRVSLSGITFGPPIISTPTATTYSNHDLALAVQGLAVVGKCGVMRAVPDSACRIAFQALARTNPITIEAIAASLTMEPGVALMDM